MKDQLVGLQQAVLASITMRDTPERTLSLLCHLVEEISPRSIATVMRLDPEEGVLNLSIGPSLNPRQRQFFQSLRPGPHSGSCGAAVFSGRMEIVSDTETDSRWDALRPLARELGIRSCWSIPLLDRERNILGTFAVSGMSVRSPSDEQRQLLSIAADLAGLVIELDRVDSSARSQSALLRAIVENTEDPIFAKDLEGRYTFANRAQAEGRGLTPSEMMGLTDDDVFTADEARWNRSTDLEVIRTGVKVVRERSYVQRPSGEILHFLVQKYPYLDENGEICGVMGIARDVTELREAERATQRSRHLESLGVLAGGVAHDFNNLMMTVLANSELLRDGSRQARHREQAIDDIQVSARRAAELTDQLLMFAGKSRPIHRVMDVAATVSQALRLVKADGDAITWNEDVQESLPPVEADPVQVRQVIVNLLRNAKEALGVRGGSVTVRARFEKTSKGSEDAVLVIEVHDDGCGIDEQDRDRVFEPFFSTKATGRGLGLAAARGIVAAHCGRLEVLASEEGGTLVRISLPARRVAAPAAPKISRAIVGSTPKRVLVIEDDASVLRVVEQILVRRGVNVLTAREGSEGLRILEAENETLDVILVDLTMEGMDGAAFMKAAREKGFHVPIVVMTGLGAPDADRHLGELRPQAILRKPFDGDSLERTLCEATAGAEG
ncbi:MAG TPA: sensor histidine kinase [Planctomycetes bacterium]|nr:sensor histidine kinase [Planctomycetota bacterium]